MEPRETKFAYDGSVRKISINLDVDKMIKGRKWYERIAIRIFVSIFESFIGPAIQQYIADDTEITYKTCHEYFEELWKDTDKLHEKYDNIGSEIEKQLEATKIELNHKMELVHAAVEASRAEREEIRAANAELLKQLKFAQK